ncbi:Mce protein [Mycobacterium sp. 663a-19]|uniref:Mce protein n=1 Tax=Mycobacterium sp. 663a-19 TaxID=2986148 RepID=UPI003B63EBDB
MGADETEVATEVTAEAAPEPEKLVEPGAEETSTEATAEAAPEPEEPGEAEAAAEVAADAGDTGVERRPSRMGRGWLAAIAAVLVLAAGGIGAGGYFALRYHHESQVTARSNAAALKAAVECVSATQAPDTNAMIASEQKIIDCGTDAFRSQALLYTSMLVQAYQASNIHVQVSDVRAAVERNNKDGSVDVLVAMRVKVVSDKADNETGYRLRVKMATAEGQWKISKLDQVTK